LSNSRTSALAGTVAILTTILLAGCTADEVRGTNGSGGTAPLRAPLVVAAAADLGPAFTLLGERFEEETGVNVVFDFGSSGRLAQQAAAGAPFDLFASADAHFIDRVLEAGIGDPATRSTYAIGRLTLWARADRWGGWTSLEEAIDDSTVATIAIANPAHAPYGRAAKQVLETLGHWEALSDRLVFGDNIADTQRIASTGDADVALVALSLALAADERSEGRWVLVPSDLHAPLRQDLIVVASDQTRADLARRFAMLIASEDGRTVMRRYGFVPPDEISDAR
jgi:molybdate transport system substrate-binding protein